MAFKSKKRAAWRFVSDNSFMRYRVQSTRIFHFAIFPRQRFQAAGKCIQSHPSIRRFFLAYREVLRIALPSLGRFLDAFVCVESTIIWGKHLVLQAFLILIKELTEALHQCFGQLYVLVDRY